MQSSTKIKIMACPLGNLYFSCTRLKLFWTNPKFNGLNIFYHACPSGKWPMKSTSPRLSDTVFVEPCNDHLESQKGTLPELNLLSFTARLVARGRLKLKHPRASITGEYPHSSNFLAVENRVPAGVGQLHSKHLDSLWGAVIRDPDRNPPLEYSRFKWNLLGGWDLVVSIWGWGRAVLDSIRDYHVTGPVTTAPDCEIGVRSLWYVDVCWRREKDFVVVFGDDQGRLRECAQLCAARNVRQTDREWFISFWDLRETNDRTY